jgi:hypothetical protein
MELTNVRSTKQFRKWFNSNPTSCTAKKMGVHPSVDLRDVRVECTGVHEDFEG